MNLTTAHQRPSAVSGRVIEQHRGLETKLNELSRVAKTLPNGGPAALSRALTLTQTLSEELTRHIVLETKLLVPALLDADAWGVIRARKLIERLRTRRQEIADLRETCACGQSGTLGQQIDRFIDDRRADMVHAERHVLNADVLRDDILGIDVDGG